METLLEHVDGPVRTLTLNRPEKRNALDGRLLSALAAAFSAPPAATERVTVLRAMGPAFCAGVDLRERTGQASAAEWVSIETTVRAIERYPLPVVAVVQGDAIAGGCELALHADFVVAAAPARFGMPLAQLGLALSWALVKKLLEVVGPVGARELLLLGDPVSAEQLRALGAIVRVVPAARLDAEVTALIERLASNAPLSLRAMKATLLRAEEYRERIDHADVDALIAAARSSADAQEGMRARLERRVPRFSGG